MLGACAAKLGQEREAQLAGRIVTADFYSRQLTPIEMLQRGHDPIDIVENDGSRLIDAIGREHQPGAASRSNQHPPRHPLVEHDGFSTAASGDIPAATV